MARTLGYRPNLAARYLSSKKSLRVLVNTLEGTTSFWDEVRAGIREEAASIPLENVEIEFRTYPHLGQWEEEVFETAIQDKVDGIITFPAHPKTFRPWIRRASRARIPVVCVTTDAPNSGRLGIVAIDTLASGSIAADLMGRFLGGQEGTIAITLFDLAITEHAEKFAAFDTTLRSFYPSASLEAGRGRRHAGQACKYRELFEKYSDLAGIYVTTEDSMPVLKAARDAKVLERLTIITTDLFPDLVSQIRSGAVAATIYQRPRTQGRMSFRMLYKFLSEGDGSAFHQIALAPHLVMRGNLDFFLQRQSEESVTRKLPTGLDLPESLFWPNPGAGATAPVPSPRRCGRPSHSAVPARFPKATGSQSVPRADLPPIRNEPGPRSTMHSRHW
jgi:LacI family transcriptional regulator